MIEQDVIAHLKADATLDTLLGATGSDSKIYPDTATQMDQLTPPFIAYSVEPVGSFFEKLIDEDSFVFRVVTTLYDDGRAILDRLKFLLEINDGLRVGVNPPTSISSATFYIYSGIISGGAELYDTDTRRFIRSVYFNFTYKKKA